MQQLGYEAWIYLLWWLLLFGVLSVFLLKASGFSPSLFLNLTLKSFIFWQSRKIDHLLLVIFFPFHPCSGGRLRFMFRCLRFLRFHAPTPTLITLQTSLKRINFSGSSRWIISGVHIVCDYCSVTPDADPGLCAALYVWEECGHSFSLQIPQFLTCETQFFSSKKEQFTQIMGHYLLTPMQMEGQVKLCCPQNISAASRQNGVYRILLNNSGPQDECQALWCTLAQKDSLA